MRNNYIGAFAPPNAATVRIARIIRTILQYPVGAEVGFTDEFITEYRTVTGYQYSHGAFYVLFSERSMVHMNRLDELVVSVKIKRRARDASKVCGIEICRECAAKIAEVFR